MTIADTQVVTRQSVLPCYITLVENRGITIIQDIIFLSRHFICDQITLRLILQ